MKNTIWLVAALSMALAGAACGDDSDNGGDTGGSGGSSATGGTGGMAGTGGTAGTGGMQSGNACTTICNSPCVVELSELSPDDIEQCEQGCGISFSGCETETLNFITCIEAFDCDQNAAAVQCQSEGLDFAQCFL